MGPDSLFFLPFFFFSFSDYCMIFPNGAIRVTTRCNVSARARTRAHFVILQISAALRSLWNNVVLVHTAFACKSDLDDCFASAL